MIRIVGAREHNLANISLEIPRFKLVVITGISGSGKSSLAFDTIYAEGQRRYVESLSAYARQFLQLMEKPDVDIIEGLSPAISIEQRAPSRNPRSTVGTVTEIYDYMRLLYARIGIPHCPQCGKRIVPQSPQSIIREILQTFENQSVAIFSPLVRGRIGTYEELFNRLRRSGFVQVRVDGAMRNLEKIRAEHALSRYKKHTIELLVDRLRVDRTERERIADAVETALKESRGLTLVETTKAARGARSSARHAPRAAPPAHQASLSSAKGPVLQTSLSTAKGLRLHSSSASGGGRGTWGTGSESAPGQGPGTLGAPEARSEARRETLTRGAVPGASGTEPAGSKIFSEHHACPECGLSLPEIEPRLFSFNSPYGACPDCGGLGIKTKVDPSLVVPDETLSIRDGAIAAWSNPVTTRTHRWKRAWSGYYDEILNDACRTNRISMNVPFKRLSQKQKHILFYGEAAPPDEKAARGGRGTWSAKDGDPGFEGVIRNLERRHRKTESEFVKEEIYNRFMVETTCPTCNGSRLKREAHFVKVGRLGIAEAAGLSVKEVHRFFKGLTLTNREKTIAKQALKELLSRLEFLVNVGLEYLTLDRKSQTLASGEAQRIHLATQIGLGLTGVLYVLDEPTIGLHARDNERLLRTLKRLRDIGNTLIVVEHDEETIRSADWIVDLGPGAGAHGGRVVAQGGLKDIISCPESVTGQYLSGELSIPVPSQRRPAGEKALRVLGACQFNLKNIDIDIPLGLFVCVTGVSGSGKSTLVHEVIYKALARTLYHAKNPPGRHRAMEGTGHVDKVIVVDQSPIGRTPRSNPATYTGVFSPVRDLFSQTQEARRRGYKPGRFSFNVKGGRCENCRGDGTLRIQMQFLPDVYVKCEECRGLRFNEETLQVRYKGKNISEVLEMSAEEASDFFSPFSHIKRILSTLCDVGLGYIKLGQSATTLSGGEAQRVKLSSELCKRSTGKTLYILDEPTTGLHFADVKNLLGVLHKLVSSGNTVLVIEHNLDVIKTADWIVDLGPEGGDAGGRVVASGPPSVIAENPESHTGRYLTPLLKCGK